MSQQQNNDMQQHFYRASAADFGKIPGSPVVYWLKGKFAEVFDEKPIGNSSGINAAVGLFTCNNNIFMRAWQEVSFSNIEFNASESTKFDDKYWVPYNKGGPYRRWFGNIEFIVNYFDGGRLIREYRKSAGQSYSLPGECNYFKEGITWTDLTSGSLSVRYLPPSCIYDVSGHAASFESHNELLKLLGYCNTKFVEISSKVLNTTFHFQVGDFKKLPYPTKLNLAHLPLIENLVSISADDWNSLEVSLSFKRLHLNYIDVKQPYLNDTYASCRSKWNKIATEMQRLEEENNRIFIEAYGLQDELTPEVPLSEITLTCNPHYRYGGNLTDDEREARLQSDTIAELISYAIGCMMGRYSLDREGLVYAHAGNEGFKALVEEGAYATFAADDDGILPLTSENWFSDDVAARIEAFVATVWGRESLEENLNFIADSLTLNAIKPVKKGGETARETLRRYLSTQFYKDHLKTYKKRPIYWLFSSGKEKAFECLVYLHRYSESTLPRMRTEYVTPLLGQMASRIERKRMEQTEASTAEAKRIGKEIDSLNKQLTELRAFDDLLKHHADMRIQLDLDDGVKVNYGKFGTLLSDVKAITGDKGE
ncbi:BREX-1 system adenine-specific DNA-methyltransferase PglX [Aeromonas media]|uniref:BREX-1 system adenine-specific DNA-methyltransferase PglX n=1 Tax=Aeromonas media TaxID=651 RepID=UPI00148B1A52|nr:BREX-1 system adenine-specific DNA-methyltransferase PglX [Aeromonas media]QJT27440.1 BREX-1 system adenine-specific DNA-methyltransferase PglX [Aeromonas media]